MTDFQLVDPQGWELDLQSIYSAYLNHFQLHNIAWYDRTWGHLFASFEAFLAFGWPAIVVTDAFTGRGHVVTRMDSISAFLKMIKTRFGENLTTVDNILCITPFETHARHLRTITDAASYKKLHTTLPATVLAAQKHRVKSGDPKWVRELWEKRDKTFLALDFEWSERNPTTFLEWGYAAVRCGHLDAMGIWPPVPETNYRKGHYVVAEYMDKIRNKLVPNYPREYAFGDSQVVPKAKCADIIQATITSLASPDSETVPNQLVLVVHGGEGNTDRITTNLKIKIPHNILTIDTASLEKSLFSQGLRGDMLNPATNQPRQRGSTLSLSATLRSLLHGDLGCRWHCSGNDAFGTLLALQLLFRDYPSTRSTVPAAKRTKSPSPLRVPPQGAADRTLMSRARTPTVFLNPAVSNISKTSLVLPGPGSNSGSGSGSGSGSASAPRSEKGAKRSGSGTETASESSDDEDARGNGSTTSTAHSEKHPNTAHLSLPSQRRTPGHGYAQKTALRSQSSFGALRNGRTE